MESAPPPIRQTNRRMLTIVRHKNKHAKPKHVYLVTRKPHEGEELDLCSISTAFSHHTEHRPGETTSVQPSAEEPFTRDAEGLIVKRSILGSLQDLEEVETLMYGGEDEANYTNQPDSPKSTISRKSRLTQASGGDSIEEIPDPLIDRVKYLEHLSALQKKALQVRIEEERLEKELMENLPLDEKIATKREAQVLERWLKREQEWEDIKAKMARLTGRNQEELAMSTTSDYREKSEVYDVLQMAMPTKEKQGLSYWQMDLRNNAERFDVVGNRMSGLYCPVRERQHAPAALRRSTRSLRSDASQTSSVHKVPKWKTSKYLEEMRKRLKKTIPLVRPHDVSLAEVEGLVVESQDLFQWAINSSKEYYRNIDDFEEQSSMKNDFASTTYSEDTNFDGRSTLDPASANSSNKEAGSLGVRLEICSCPNLLFEGQVNELVQKGITVKNTGSTTIFWEIRKLELGMSLTAAFAAPERKDSVGSVTSTFLCYEHRGTLLPSEEKTIFFSFKANHTGAFSERWKMVTTPKAIVTDSSGDKPGGSHEIFLKGISGAEDTNEHRRIELRNQLNQKIWDIEVENVVQDLVRTVKTPRREEVIRHHEKVTFEGHNSSAGLRYSSHNYDALRDLFSDVRKYLLQVKMDAGFGTEDDLEWIPEVWDSSVDTIRDSILKALVATGDLEKMFLEGFHLKWIPPPPPPREKKPKKSVDSDEDEDASVEEPELPIVPVVVLPDIEPASKDAIVFMDRLRVLVLDCCIRPLPNMEVPARSALEEFADTVDKAFEKARTAAGLGTESINPLPSAFTPEGAEAWATIMNNAAENAKVAAPDPKTKGKDVRRKSSIKGIPQPSVPAPNQIDLYRYTFYQEVYAELGKAVDGFFVSAYGADQESAEQYVTDHRLSFDQVAFVREEDVRDLRVLVHLDLDLVDSFTLGPDGQWSLTGDAQKSKYSKLAEAIQSLKILLSYNPKCLIIATYLNDPPIQKGSESSSVQPTTCDFKQALTDGLGLQVTYLEDLRPLLSGEATEGVFLLEHLRDAKLVPALEPPPIAESDDEEERIPTFEDELTRTRRIRKEKKELHAILHPNIGVALRDIIDLFIADDPQSTKEQKNLFHDLSPLTPKVAGLTLHRDIIACHRLLNSQKRPLLAIIGGSRIQDRIRMLDTLIDKVNTLIIGGSLGINFLYASGADVGMSSRVVDKAILPILRKLLNKMQRRDIEVILPKDFYAGEAGVTRWGQEKLPEDDDEEEEDGADENIENQQQQAEEVDPAAGFDYDYEVKVYGTGGEGIPSNVHLLDVGPETIKMIQESLRSANAIFWDGPLGVVECSAFQESTKAIVAGLMEAHDARGAVVVVNGGATAFWARALGGLDEVSEEEVHDSQDPEEDEEITLEPIKGFSHLCHESTVSRAVLGQIRRPIFDILDEREPMEDELLIEEELRVKEIARLKWEQEERERKALEEDEEDEDEEEEDEDEDD